MRLDHKGCRNTHCCKYKIAVRCKTHLLCTHYSQDMLCKQLLPHERLHTSHLHISCTLDCRSCLCNLRLRNQGKIHHTHQHCNKNLRCKCSLLPC